MSQGAGEKTEHPTGKRLKDARKKGQVAKSKDLSSALVLLAAVGVLWLAGKYIGAFALESIKNQFTYAAAFNGAFTEEVVFAAFGKGLIGFVAILTPLVLVVWLFSLVVGYLQVGSIFAAESVKPKFSKLNPAEGIKDRFLSIGSYVELLGSLVKILVAAAITGSVLWGGRTNLVLLMSRSIDVAVTYAFGVFIEIGFKIGIAFFALGALDFLFQTLMLRRSLKMTKSEVKDEHKETEGNPLTKSRQKFLHKELVKEGVAAAVLNADVVITGREDIAVAIGYDQSSGQAPVVVAKGADLMASQLKTLARESSIPITRDIRLAKALSGLGVGDEIPADLFESVAIVLRWVYGVDQSESEPGMKLGVAGG